jgi:hypothetical protein
LGCGGDCGGVACNVRAAISDFVIIGCWQRLPLLRWRGGGKV